jgi:hypothetical protein
MVLDPDGIHHPRATVPARGDVACRVSTVPVLAALSRPGTVCREKGEGALDRGDATSSLFVARQTTPGGTIAAALPVARNHE